MVEQHIADFDDILCNPTDRRIAVYFFNNCPKIICNVGKNLYLLNKINKWEKAKDIDLFDPVYELYIKEIDDQRLTREERGVSEEDLFYFDERCKKFITKIESHNKMSVIIKSLIPLYKDQIKFDQNPYLIGFTNKVYDLEKMQARNYKPEDYITMSVGFKYETPNQERTNKLYEILNKIFPDPNIKQSVLSILARSLLGKQLKHFTFFNGCADNGKSALVTLMSATLGDYACRLPITILTQNHKDGPCPPIANLHLKRLILSSEPRQNKDSPTFNTSIIKIITGDTDMNARMLYSNDMHVQLTGTILCELNNKPLFDQIDAALAHRIIQIPFDSTFVSPLLVSTAILTKPNTYLADVDINSAPFANQYRMELMSILLQTYLFTKGEITLSERIIKEANDLIIVQSPFLYWFNNRFKRDINSNPLNWVTIPFIHQIYTTEHGVRLVRSLNKNNQSTDSNAISYEDITEQLQSLYYFKQDLTNGTMMFWIALQ